MDSKNQPVEEIARMFSNPFYCLDNGIAKVFTLPHDQMVTEEEWIKTGSKLIGEIGAENYLRHLLENLKGNYV